MIDDDVLPWLAEFHAAVKRADVQATEHAFPEFIRIFSGAVSRHCTNGNEKESSTMLLLMCKVICDVEERGTTRCPFPYELLSHLLTLSDNTASSATPPLHFAALAAATLVAENTPHGTYLSSAASSSTSPPADLVRHFAQIIEWTSRVLAPRADQQQSTTAELRLCGAILGVMLSPHVLLSHLLLSQSESAAFVQSASRFLEQQQQGSSSESSSFLATFRELLSMYVDLLSAAATSPTERFRASPPRQPQSDFAESVSPIRSPQGRPRPALVPDEVDAATSHDNTTITDSCIQDAVDELLAATGAAVSETDDDDFAASTETDEHRASPSSTSISPPHRSSPRLHDQTGQILSDLERASETERIRQDALNSALAAVRAELGIRAQRRNWDEEDEFFETQRDEDDEPALHESPRQHQLRMQQHLTPTSRRAWEEYEQRSRTKFVAELVTKYTTTSNNNNSRSTSLASSTAYHSPIFDRRDHHHHLPPRASSSSSSSSPLGTTTAEDARVALLERQLRDAQEKHHLEQQQWQRHASEQQRQLHTVLEQRSQTHFGRGDLHF